MLGSVSMYEMNRFWTHMVLASVSFLLHVCLRPHNSKATNFTAIMFSIADLLGSFAGYSGTNAVQPVYIVFLLLTLLGVIVIAYQAAHKRMEYIKKYTANMNNNDNDNDMFASFSKREKTFLFPILVLVFVSTKVGQQCFKTVGDQDGVELKSKRPSTDMFAQGGANTKTYHQNPMNNVHQSGGRPSHHDRTTTIEIGVEAEMKSQDKTPREQLKELKTLLEDGLITQDQFTTKQQAIVAKM